MEPAIFTNMVMISDDTKVLVQQRTKNWVGITFPGGHVEKDESFVMSAIREIKEETGLTISNLQLCGMKQFQTKNDERYVVIFYKTTCFEGTLQSSDEGEVFWVEKTDLQDMEVSDGFLEMVQVMDDHFLSEFQYTDDGAFILR